GATLNSASLELYYFLYDISNPSGKTVWAYKLTRTDWVEGVTEVTSTSGATWNDYKIIGETHYTWTAPGGDYVTSSPAGGSTTFPADYGWMTWNVLAIVQDAYDGSIAAEFLVKFATEGLASDYTKAYWRSKEYSPQPKLVIDYTLLVELENKSANMAAKMVAAGLL
ncbi:unnamed protein product, partial [marine sediment metagenome]